jgi:hypothetical protein
VNAAVMQKHISKTASSGVVARDFSGGTGGLSTFNIAAPTVVPEGVKVRENEKLLYVMYFQTSKFATFAGKIGQLKLTKTDHTQYWDIYEDLTASFASDERWDVFDMEGFIKQGRNPNNNVPADPLIIIDAVHTAQPWFRNYAKPSIYDHVFDLALRGLFGSDVHLADGRFYGQPSFSHPDPQAVYRSASIGPITVPYENTAPQATTIMQLPHAGILSGITGTAGAAVYTLKIQYLHSANIPTDFTNLYFAAARVLSEYYRGGENDADCEIYGEGDWIRSNLSWLQALGTSSWANYTLLYKAVDAGTYTLDFAYSPKFNWTSNDPWVSKDFTYGQTKALQMPGLVKPVLPASSGVKKIKRP